MQYRLCCWLNGTPKRKKGVSTLLIHLFAVVWVVMDSNHRRHSQQIYSLPHLATLVTTR